MIEESTKHHWLKVAAIALIVFIATFLAFYIVMEIMYNRITDPNIEIKRFEKMVKQEQKFLRKIDDKFLDSPFEPKMRPMIVNLVRENEEYKIIVDLTTLDGDENAVNVSVNDKILTVTGELDKKFHGNERIINFTQSYYLDEQLDFEEMTKEKKGNKYIITIPFED
ncbi:MAG: hypothetical protein E7Z92_03570 [Cyanobacteria bacterium SIG31]|nr:hypothetical protein [Cyanobacteria bacterium SIG31]